MPSVCELSKHGLSFYADANASAAVAHLHLDNSTPAAPKLRVYAADGATPAYLSAKIAPPTAAPDHDDAVNAGWIRGNFQTASQVASAVTAAIGASVAFADGQTPAGAVRHAIDSAVSALTTRARSAETKVGALEATLAGVTHAPPVAPQAASEDRPAVLGAKRTYKFGTAADPVKIIVSDLEVTNTTTANVTVTNTRIKDQCVVYGHGAMSDETASLLFSKGTGGAGAPLYAGIVREPAAVGTSVGTFKFVDNGTAAGADADRISGLATTTAYAKCVAEKFQCQSDQRLKENVVPIDGALAKVGAMRGVYYDWIDKAKGSARQIGVIAQEVQAACPELVDASDAYLTVDYARIAAVLIEAVKDLTARNAALDARVAALEKAA
jgi:hypothetical protein